LTSVAGFLAVVAIAIRLSISWDYGRHVTASEANGRIHQAFHLPATASNVNYSTNVRASQVTFDISQADLARWCKDEGWLVQQPRSGARVFMEMRDDNQWRGTHVVEHGLEFSKHGRSFTGLYDSDLGRACVLYVGD